MASDGLCLVHNAVINLQTQKLRRLRSGAIVGCAGESTEAVAFADWLDAGAEMAAWPKLKSCDALVLHPDGSLFLYEEANEGRCEQVFPPMAIGSGMDFALGALDAGAAPNVAVEVAIKRCMSCGGQITVMSPVHG